MVALFHSERVPGAFISLEAITTSLIAVDFHNIRCSLFLYETSINVVERSIEQPAQVSAVTGTLCTKIESRKFSIF